MEEAYSELYQQFVRLRSLCLKQAAMLHQLTTAMQKQQGPGASVPIADVTDLMSIPVQCSHEMPVWPHEKPQPIIAATQNPTEQCGIDHLPRNARGTFSDTLVKEMSNLQMDMPYRRKAVEQKSSSTLTLDSLICNEASCNEPKKSGQNHLGGDETQCTLQIPMMNNPPLGRDLYQFNGGMMSDVALQSQICDFCQAVFPGDTTTGGEFLRHLYTHVT